MAYKYKLMLINIKVIFRYNLKRNDDSKQNIKIHTTS